jgi:hypothetical protein
VRKDKLTGRPYGHTGVPDLIALFKDFTRHILLVHFGAWFYTHIPRARRQLRAIGRENGVDVHVGYDGMTLDLAALAMSDDGKSGFRPMSKRKEARRARHSSAGLAEAQIRNSHGRSPDYQPGRPGITTAIVLSAPGRREAQAGYPAAGQTGKNLEGVLRILHARDSETYPSTSLADYPIINASAAVHHKASSGRAEAKVSELLAPENIARMKSKLRGQRTVLALGRAARVSVEASGFRGRLIVGGHPSLEHINRRYKAKGLTSSERAAKRCEMYVKELQDRSERE